MLLARISFFMRWKNPALVRARLQKNGGVKSFDKVFLAVTVPLMFLFHDHGGACRTISLVDGTDSIQTPAGSVVTTYGLFPKVLPITVYIRFRKRPNGPATCTNSPPMLLIP